MIIKVLITVILFVPTFFLTMRYNMHMFQLNGYKNGEHFNWLKKNIRKQWILVFLAVLGGTGIFLDWLILDIINWLTLLLIICVYNAMKRLNTKKKLVYTPRVKRMIFSNVVVNIIVLLAMVLLTKWEYLPKMLVIMVPMQLFMNMLSNIINRPIENAINQYYINDAKRKLKAVSGLKVIGVTGSYGKTSVKFYLQALLQEKYSVLVTPESYNTPMGVVKTIRSALKPTHEIFVCEMGARHVGDIKEICDIVYPEHGVITSIGPQHLETFFNIENIKDTKFELADALPESGMIFLNGDNEFIQEKAGGYGNVIFYYSQKEGNGYKAKDIYLSQLGTEFTVMAPNGEEERFQTKLIGEHNVINIVGAIAIANKLGIAS